MSHASALQIKSVAARRITRGPSVTARHDVVAIGCNNERDEVARHKKRNLLRYCAALQHLCGTRRCGKRAQISELEHIISELKHSPVPLATPAATARATCSW
jgi:hypothetical protein